MEKTQAAPKIQARAQIIMVKYEMIGNKKMRMFA
jgi:hypothetical protein